MGDAMRSTLFPLALLAALACALPAEAQQRRGAAREAVATNVVAVPRLPPTPRLPAAPQILIPGSLDGFNDWSRPLLFRGSRLSMPAEVRLYLCPRGGFPQRGGRCRPPAGGGGGMLATSPGSDDSVEGWHAGLRPATHAQRGCPAGTVPTVARDNPGVTRCLPA